MARNPAQASIKGDFNRAISGTVGATALQFGDLCKITAGLFVPLADNDVNKSIYVANGNYDASATRGQFIPFQDVLVGLAYNTAPTVGVAYGVSGPATIDQTDTTNKVVEVVEVDTTNEMAWSKPYQLTS